MPTMAEKIAANKRYITREYGWMVGKTIASIRPLTSSEIENMGWYEGSEIAFVVMFTDGSWFVPMSDDEGNSSGALMYEGR